MNENWPIAIAQGWHAVAACSELSAVKPLSRMLMGVPLVVFGDELSAAVLTDRCPHRGVRLSGGKLKSGTLECPYHGWRFGPDGRCMMVPGSRQVPDVSAKPLPIVVRAGLVWTTLAEPVLPFPVLPNEIDDTALDGFWWAVKPSKARVLDAIENLLDPAHPHLLHPWIVRSPSKRRPVQVTVRLGPRGAEAIYEEDASASGLMPRLLEGHRKRSVGRYFAPNIGQVAFEGDRGMSVAITVVFTPEDVTHTRPFAHFATPRGRVPAVIKKMLLKAFHAPVLRQDQAMLRAQAENSGRFDGAHYAMGPLDFLGPTIWRLANGEAQPEEQRQFEVYL